jgi:DNA-binding NtrC family response regulator
LTLAVPVGSSLAEVDRQFIYATLDLCGGVKTRAADLLGISLKTLYNRLEKFNQEQQTAILAKSMPSDQPLSLKSFERGLLN